MIDQAEPLAPARPPTAPNEIGVRLEALSQAVEAARGRIDNGVLARADLLAGRGAERLSLSGEHTIVALAGATGSGKSSLFNALSDLDLAGVGVRRPTTSWALACAWGPEGAQELLAWMGIPARHQVSRMSMLDYSADETRLDGLVLLDLPDHDSTEVSHHIEMERLLPYADVLVWVLDPQKYADAAIHDRYIRPMASYREVTVVVLNQIDRIPADERERALTDVRRILASEGLPDVPVIGLSALHGEGVDGLRRELASRIRAKESAKQRLDTDVRETARSLAEIGGDHLVPGVQQVDRERLEQALVEAVGVPHLVDAVVSSTRRRARSLTGWPLTRWAGRLRKDPYADLGLGDDLTPAALARLPLQTEAKVQRARADGAVRDFAEKAAVGLSAPWRDAVRSASTARSDDIVSAVESAVAGTRLPSGSAPVWWRLVNVVQWLGVLTLLGGGIWWALTAAGVLEDPPQALGQDLPMVLTLGALAGGIVLALLSRVLARATGRTRAARLEEALRASIHDTLVERVDHPIEGELAAYRRYQAAISTALT